MVLQRWDPFRELFRLDLAGHRPSRGVGIQGAVRHWTVPLDVVDEGDDVVVRASIPGVKSEDIDVTVEDGLLTIKGGAEVEEEGRNGRYLIRERRSGRYSRTLRLSDAVDADSAASRYEDGVLSVTFSKVEAKKARRLEIKVGE